MIFLVSLLILGRAGSENPQLEKASEFCIFSPNFHHESTPPWSVGTSGLNFPQSWVLPWSAKACFLKLQTHCSFQLCLFWDPWLPSPRVTRANSIAVDLDNIMCTM